MLSGSHLTLLKSCKLSVCHQPLNTAFVVSCLCRGDDKLCSATILSIPIQATVIPIQLQNGAKSIRASCIAILGRVRKCCGRAASIPLTGILNLKDGLVGLDVAGHDLAPRRFTILARTALRHGKVGDSIPEQPATSPVGSHKVQQLWSVLLPNELALGVRIVRYRLDVIVIVRLVEHVAVTLALYQGRLLITVDVVRVKGVAAPGHAAVHDGLGEVEDHVAGDVEVVLAWPVGNVA